MLLKDLKERSLPFFADHLRIIENVLTNRTKFAGTGWKRVVLARLSRCHFHRQRRLLLVERLVHAVAVGAHRDRAR